MLRRHACLLLVALAFLSATADGQPAPLLPEDSGFKHAYDLSGIRILVIAGEEFNAAETLGIAARWKGWGARVEFSGPARLLTGEVEAAPGAAPAGPSPALEVDVLLPAVDPSRYDVVYIAGGEGVGRLLDKGRADLARILNGADRGGKLVAAICHGPLALSASAIVKGKRVTVQGASGRQALQQAGADLSDDVVVVDGRLVTGQWPHLETFAVTVAERLEYPKGGGPYQRWLDGRPPVVRAIFDQRATHRFDGRPVAAETLEQVVRAAMKTVAPPSTRGLQALELVAVRDPAARAAIGTRVFERCKAEFASRGMPEQVFRQQVTLLFDQAPALLFLFIRGTAPVQGQPSEAVARAEIAYSGAVAANLLLAARSFGLGVSPLGLPAFLAAEPEVKKAVLAPDSAVLASILAVGYPALSATPAVSRPASDILSLEHWQGPGKQSRRTAPGSHARLTGPDTICVRSRSTPCAAPRPGARDRVI